MLVDKEFGLQDSNGMSALMFAVIYDNEECIKLLSKYEVNLVNKKGDSAAAFAPTNQKIQAILNKAK